MDLKKHVMSLVEKIKKPTPPPVDEQPLTKEELEFILVKLKTATYKGDEFEMYYNVWVKVLKALENLKEE